MIIGHTSSHNSRRFCIFNILYGGRELFSKAIDYARKHVTVSSRNFVETIENSTPETIDGYKVWVSAKNLVGLTRCSNCTSVIITDRDERIVATLTGNLWKTEETKEWFLDFVKGVIERDPWKSRDLEIDFLVKNIPIEYRKTLGFVGVYNKTFIIGFSKNFIATTILSPQISDKYYVIVSKETTIHDIFMYRIIEKINETENYILYFVKPGLEKLEIYNAYAERIDGSFIVYIYLRNTGTIDATISEIFLNNRLHDTLDVKIVNPNNITQDWTANVIGHTIRVREEFIFALNLSTSRFTSGQSIDITVRTTTGRNYSKTVVLP